MQSRDLFEDLKDKTGCVHISDMQFAPWRERARRKISKMDLSAYPLPALNDAASYLYSEHQDFADMEAAVKYFKTRRAKIGGFAAFRKENYE